MAPTAAATRWRRLRAAILGRHSFQGGVANDCNIPQRRMAHFPVLLFTAHTHTHTLHAPGFVVLGHAVGTWPELVWDGNRSMSLPALGHPPLFARLASASTVGLISGSACVALAGGRST